MLDATDGPAGVSYLQAFKDVRHAVDMCHHDGVIKDQVALDPGSYIVPDENMVPMLAQSVRRAASSSDASRRSPRVPRG